MNFHSLFFLLISLLLSISCGSKSDKNIATKTGESVGETLTDFTKGLSKGVDTQMEVKTITSQLFKDTGLQITITKISGMLDGKELAVYAIASQAINATIIAKAMDAKDREIGRANTEVVMVKDDAKYIVFKFPSQMDTQLVKEYSLDIKKTP